MALRLTSRSSRRRIPLVTVTSGLRFVFSPVGPTHLRWLDISNGCQNHTTSPYAATSHQSSDRQRADRTGEGPEAPCVRATLDHSRETRPATTIAPVHRIQPRVRDDRDTPLLPGWMGGTIAVICPTVKAECFFERDWTGSIRLIWFNKSRSARSASEHSPVCRNVTSADIA
jgi:hypothetical protein